MSIGIWQLVLILVIVFVVFGAGKLPNVMNDIGKGVKGLKDGMKDEQAKASPKKPAAVAVSAPKKTAVKKKPAAKKKTAAKKSPAKKTATKSKTGKKAA